MGCNCKKTAKAAARYADVEPNEKVGLFEGTFNVLRAVFIIILVFILIIITLPVSLPIGVFSMLKGDGVRLDRLIKRKREKE